MLDHLATLVTGHSLSQRRGNFIYGSRKPRECRRNTGVRHKRQYHHASAAFNQLCMMPLCFAPGSI
jgi:hypothetical protein